MMSVIMSSDVLIIIMLSVVMLSVIELNVVAPKIHKENSESHDKLCDTAFLEKNFDRKKNCRCPFRSREAPKTL